MRPARLLLTPVAFALRRMRARPLAVAAVIVAVAGAAALVGWSSVAAALSHEDNVRLRIGELPADRRSMQVVHHLLPGEPDATAERVDSIVADFRTETERPYRVRVWHAVGPREVRIVVPERVSEATLVANGRPPGPCTKSICEALALTGDFRVGQLVPLAPAVALRVVGRGALRPEALPAGSETLRGTPELGPSALLVPAMTGRMREAARNTGSSVVTTAALAPGGVRGSELRDLAARLRTSAIRLEREGYSLVDATVPLALLDDLADRGEVARKRLFLVAGQAAALIVVFAAFAASVRRRESGLVDEQLGTLGASRVQTWLVRTVEAGVPSIVGGLLAVAGLRVIADVAADQRGLPDGFLSSALPAETVFVITAITVSAAVLLVASLAPAPRSRFGFGPLEAAGVTALAVALWQIATTSALDPERIDAGGGVGPALLLLPALTFFGSGVVLLRIVPLALRLAERAARKGSFGVRLAFLTAARRPTDAAAATTFLAVALGAALFTLNYRTTLERQAHDEAGFLAGASARVLERAAGNGRRVAPTEERVLGDVAPPTAADLAPVTTGYDVTPLDRFEMAGLAGATPVMRLTADVRGPTVGGEELSVEVLAVPAEEIPRMLGWRNGFSDHPLPELARRLRPRPVRLAGPRIADDAQALRVSALSTTRLPRFIVLHFLSKESQSFTHVRIGDVDRARRMLYVAAPDSLRGAMLVGVEFPPSRIPLSAVDDSGYVELGRFQQLRNGRWSALPSLDEWSPSASGGSVDVPIEKARRGRLRFEVPGVGLALMRPPVPDSLPAVVSPSVAAAAVDGVVILGGLSSELRLRVSGTAKLFPTIVQRPRFVVLDYDTLFAALNAEQPGAALPGEAWFFARPPNDFARRLARPAFRVDSLVEADALRARVVSDPLAAGTRDVLGTAAAIAAALGLLGLILAVRSGLASERLLLAEYEALGIPPGTLGRSTQLRLVAISLAGIVAGVAGGVAAVRLVGAYVAVTGSGERPLPPIEPAVAWRAGGAVAALVAVAALAVAGFLAGRALRETAARRLRA